MKTYLREVSGLCLWYTFFIHLRSTKNIFNLNRLMMIRVNWPTTCNGDLLPGEHFTASQCPGAAQTGNCPTAIALGCVLLSQLMMMQHPFSQHQACCNISIFLLLLLPLPPGSCCGSWAWGDLGQGLHFCYLCPDALCWAADRSSSREAMGKSAAHATLERCWRGKTDFTSKSNATAK